MLNSLYYDILQVTPMTPATPTPFTPIVYKPPATENELIDSMKEEVDEARRLAEEWELKYKEMHRQMEELDMGRKLVEDVAVGRRMSVNQEPMQRMISTQSSVIDECNG